MPRAAEVFALQPVGCLPPLAADLFAVELLGGCLREILEARHP
jgi:hypothetical protein